MSNLNHFPILYLKRDRVLPFQKTSLDKEAHAFVIATWNLL